MVSCWKETPLKEDIILISGRHILAEDVCEEATGGEGVPYITGPADFVDGQIQATKLSVKPDVMCSLGDILLIVKGSGTGTVVRADKAYCISRQIMAIRPQAWNADFLHCVLKSLTLKYRNSAAGLIPGISRIDILNTRILVPPIHVQEHIGKIDCLYENSIRQLSCLISAKLRLKRGLMQQLLTGKRRFEEFVKSGETIHTRFGRLPVDWDYVKVRDIATELNERNGINENLPVLSCTKYDGLVNSLEYFGRQVFSKDTSAYKIVRKGQFAYATNHIEEGSIGLLTQVDAGLVSPMYTTFGTAGSVDAEFLYALFKTELYTHIFARTTSGTINRRGSLRWKQFAEIHVGLPSIAEQRKIAAVLSVADNKTNLLRRKLELLKQQKRGLMQKLLTGKVRVKI